MSAKKSTKSDTIRVCLLGSSVLDLIAYRLLLEHKLDYKVTVESDFTPTAVWAAMRCKPNLVIVNADTATTQAVDAVQMITRLLSAARIMILGSVDPLRIQAWSSCRIHGYVVKGGGIEELRAALQAMSEYRQYYSEGVRHALRYGNGQAAGGATKLSRREAELLPLLARGLTLREAAQAMTVSYKTADSYRTNLLRKLGLRDRVELARYAIREKIIEA